MTSFQVSDLAGPGVGLRRIFGPQSILECCLPDQVVRLAQKLQIEKESGMFKLDRRGIRSPDNARWARWGEEAQE